MYECKLCHHRATHPAFLRCQRCYTMRQQMRPESHSFAPSPVSSDDGTTNMLMGMALGSALSSSPSPSYSGGGGTFDGGGSSGSYDSGSSSSSCSSDSSSSSSDSGSSCSTD
jgi:hypothetical protein